MSATAAVDSNDEKLIRDAIQKLHDDFWLESESKVYIPIHEQKIIEFIEILRHYDDTHETKLARDLAISILNNKTLIHRSIEKSEYYDDELKKLIEKGDANE
jgi:hypothetical protein